MKLEVLSVGRPGPLLAQAIEEYETRAARYWSLRYTEVRAEPARKGVRGVDVREAEGKRLLERVSRGSKIVALTRSGEAWSSEELSRFLQELAVQGGPDQAFLIGGALGLPEALLRRADRRLRLSSFTLPHDLARLMFAEQLYRAGAIARGEPYHKGAV